MTLSVDLETISIASHTPDGAVEIDMSLTGLLGCGAHGIVRLGRVLETGELVAVKVSPLATSGKSSLKELTVLTTLPAHPHVVGVRSAQVNVVDGSLYLVLELCPGGELFDRIAEEGGLAEDEAKASFVQILAAIGHCHAGGVFHRDLKPENILLDADNRVKVADFGLASVREREVASTAFLQHTACGSVMYAAPELHRDAEEGTPSDEGYDPEKADIWSLGIVLYCMLTARLPFAVAHPQLCARYAQALASGFTVMCPETLSEQAVSILNAMLAIDPHRRPSARELMAHAWLDGVRLPDAPCAPSCVGAPPKWSEYSTYLVGPDGGKEARLGSRKRAASGTWDALAPITPVSDACGDDDDGDAAQAAAGDVTPPAPVCCAPPGALAAGKRLRLDGGGEASTVGMPDLVRHLGWEQLDASAVELLESVMKALDRLGLKYTVDRKTSSVSVPPTAALGLASSSSDGGAARAFEQAASGDYETRLAEVTIRITPSARAAAGEDQRDISFIRSGGCTIAFHSLYKAWRKEMAEVNRWDEQTSTYIRPVPAVPA